MKKRYFVLFVVFFTIHLSAENSALSQYLKTGWFLPKSERVNLKAGYENFWGYDARLKQEEQSSGRVERFKQMGNSALVLLNFFQYVDIYSTLGSSNIKTNWKIYPPSGIETMLEAQTQDGFFWSIGSNITLWKNNLAAVALGARYFFTRPKLSWLTSNGSPVNLIGEKLKAEQWQANLLLSYQIGIFVPYLGMQYSDMRASLKNIEDVVMANNGENSLSMGRRDLFGFFIGTSITNGEILSVNLEAHFIDEEVSIISAIFYF